VFASLALVVTTRPFGAPIVGAWLLLETLPHDSRLRTGFVPRWGAIVAVVVLPVLMFFFSSAPGKLVQIERGWREGWIMYKGKSDFFLTEYVYTARPNDSFIEFILSNIDHIMIMGLLRIVVFFVPLIGGAGFSPFWTTLNVVVLGPLTLCALYGIIKAVRVDYDVFALLAVPAIVILGIASITFVSLSWRYRAPLGPVLAVLTGYVVARDGRINQMVEHIIPT